MIMKVPNSLLVDQARQNGGPDLSPNCLQRLSADSTGRLKVTGYPTFCFISQ